jgi:TPR repeat protein
MRLVSFLRPHWFLEQGILYSRTKTNCVLFSATGDPDCAFALACAYSKGAGVQEDHAEAYKLYHFAAEHGTGSQRLNTPFVSSPVDPFILTRE